jgi:hypothetical protein
LRDLTRYRTRLLDERSAAANRLHKVLEDANIKLSSVVTDIQGVSARLIIDALNDNQLSPEQMAELAKRKLRQKILHLVEALKGRMRDHHRFLLQDSILIIIFNLLKKPDTSFQDLGGDYFLTKNKEQEKRRALQVLDTLGFQVSCTPTPVAA